MFKNAKIGDNVWSIKDGWGVICSVCDREMYPIKVDFNGRGTNLFNLEGRENVTDVCPSLLWHPLYIPVQKRPKKTIEKTLTGWVNVFTRMETSSTMYFSEEEANAASESDLKVRDRIACVKVIGNYTIEG